MTWSFRDETENYVFAEHPLFHQIYIWNLLLARFFTYIILIFLESTFLLNEHKPKYSWKNSDKDESTNLFFKCKNDELTLKFLGFDTTVAFNGLNTVFKNKWLFAYHISVVTILRFLAFRTLETKGGDGEKFIIK